MRLTYDGEIGPQRTASGEAIEDVVVPFKKPNLNGLTEILCISLDK